MSAIFGYDMDEELAIANLRKDGSFYASNEENAVSIQHFGRYLCQKLSTEFSLEQSLEFLYGFAKRNCSRRNIEEKWMVNREYRKYAVIMMLAFVYDGVKAATNLSDSTNHEKNLILSMFCGVGHTAESLMILLENGRMEEKLWGLMRCVAFTLHTNSSNPELRRLSKARKVAIPVKSRRWPDGLVFSNSYFLQFLKDKFIPRYIEFSQRVESYFNPHPEDNWIFFTSSSLSRINNVDRDGDNNLA